MGAQWKHSGRIQNSSIRGALISKLVKEITVAAKVGDPNPTNNHRLKAAMEAAKKASVPKDTIDRAIKKGAGLTDETVQYETVIYEGFTPYQLPIIVECLTDNKNRTAADMRVLFRKGQLGNVGCVSWQFDRLGVVEASHAYVHQDREEVAIEAGAQNVEPLEAEDVPANHIGARFFCLPTDLDAMAKVLNQKQWVITLSELSYIAKNRLILPEDQKKEVTGFLEAIDDHDDVHRIFVAMQ